MSGHSISCTPSTTSSPDALSPLPKKRKVESITSLSDIHTDVDEPPVTLRALRDSVPRNYIPGLFDVNILTKIFRTASASLECQSATRKPDAGRYEFRDPEFWTCGFFPGSLHALLERSIKYPQRVSVGFSVKIQDVRTQLRSLSQAWSRSLHSTAFRTDTHDIGFIVMPALKRDWELFGHEQSLRSIIHAARSLATRYVPTAGAIRSWECLVKREITVTDQSENTLVIIDSLCNLDLLFYASLYTGDESLAKLAETHARTLLRTHLREENSIAVPKGVYQGQLYSTCHAANIDPSNGDLKWRWTAKEYSNDSTWARGQAWAILGYAQTYMWTKDTIFLDAACDTAEYFLHRLTTAPSCVETTFNELSPYPFSSGTEKGKRKKGRHVPLWDFDAPVDPSSPLRDSSAGVIAANGMLVLFQALLSIGQDNLARRFLDAAVEIVRDTIDLCLAPEKAQLVGDGPNIRVEDGTPGCTFDSILKNGTADNNQHARRRYSNHGLVFGDYYLIEFGNRLLDLGLVR
ncbi:Six-hairpin glycosidase-like protein [Aspergillus desertorum]